MSGAFRDNLNILSKLTWRRVVNAMRVRLSFRIAKWTKKAVHWGMPTSVAIEPTTACNLECPECPSGLRKFTRPTGNLNKEAFEKTIDQLSRTLTYLTFYFQGEPYINPNLHEMVSYAAQKGIYTAISTNGHFLDLDSARKTVESGLDRLIISLDGTTQEVYESYRKNGKLEKVLDGARNVIKAKQELGSSTPHVIFQFLVVKPNEHQIGDAKDLAAKMGVNEIRFKTSQVYDYKNGNDLIPDSNKYSRYSQNEDGSYSIKNSLLKHCWRMWHSCVITWDGKIVPCCFDKDATHRLGDLNETEFKAIWKSDEYAAFRTAVLRSRNEIDICKNCTEGTKVWT